MFLDYFNSQQTEITLKREIETLIKRNRNYHKLLNNCHETIRYNDNVQKSNVQNIKRVAKEEVK